MSKKDGYSAKEKGQKRMPFSPKQTEWNPIFASTFIDALTSDLASLRHASSQLVFHYRAGDFAKDKPTHCWPPCSPAAPRPRSWATAPVDRVVGCCRDAVVLFIALARHKGIPARGRVGFVSYFHEGWFIDHVVAEVWDNEEKGWRLVETELEGESDGIDYLDLTEEQFITGPRAWRLARAGVVDPARFVVSPSLDLNILRGWPYLAHNVLHDLVWWDKKEMLLWDYWGMQGELEEDAREVPESLAKGLDEISAITMDPRTDLATLRTLLSRNGLDVPRVVRSVDPNSGTVSKVDVSRMIEK
ncbi:hypothetical protein B0T18DRAFT_389311 [Schizothecium vesticola]|uniref:Transglutaminase-like domain-containing protein n=1 Tax=Schizothecium vesticola TaxID=314040 RepID=A0AA40K8C9_9PEZI|nr:hypothetical protein B0T18DRAFT_389311 [Schizothecium vesticola]